MRYSTTLFVRIARMIPKSMIQNAIAAFGTDRRVRTLGSRDHLWTLLLGHIHGVASLRHLVTLWKDLPELRGCLGMKEPARSTLADANASRSHEFFRALAAQILQACLNTQEAKRHRRLKRISYCLDSTSIGLCVDLFAWAFVSQERSAIKLNSIPCCAPALPCRN